MVDDHELIRDGIRAMLMGHPRIKVTGDVHSAKSCLEKIKNISPDLVLMDIRMGGGMSGIEATKIIQQEHPRIRVLMLTANTDAHHLREAIKAGAMGFLPKNTGEKELIRAIETVGRGEPFYGEKIAPVVYQTLSQHIQNPTKAHQEALSSREIEIIRLFADGLSYKEVAAELSISPSTVESHRKNIQKKLGTKNLVELVRYAIRKGIIEA